MKQGWEILPFENCIKKVKYTAKIASSDYLTTGAYPIISQEEEMISGYWDKKEDVFAVSSPVVIFGDHTRVLKYVDFDFVLGADGVKILQPTDCLDAKFLMYFLKSCKIPSLGYSRHYKLLKETSVPVPERAEQERIVGELDCLSGIIANKRAQLRELDTLAQSIFYTMFGDPITNDKGWQTKKLGDVALIVGGSTPSTREETNWNGDLNWVTPAELNGTLYYGETQRKITTEGARGLELLPVGTVLLSSRAPIGKLAITTVPMYCNQGFKNVVCGESINNIYVYYYLLATIENIKALGVGATFKEVSKRAVENYNILVPPIDLQQQFAEKIENIERQKELITKSIKETEDLFNSRMSYYFD